jgi:hypothetical protein
MRLCVIVSDNKKKVVSLPKFHPKQRKGKFQLRISDIGK